MGQEELLNALRCATLFNDSDKDAIRKLLTKAFLLSPNSQHTLFSQLSSYRLLLMLQAVCGTLEQLSPLLEAISGLDTKLQLEIFTYNIGYRENILMVAAKNTPQAVAPMLGVVAKLGYTEQQSILGGLTPTGYARKYFNKASLSSALQPIIAHMEVVYSWGQLQVKVNEFDKKAGFILDPTYLSAYYATKTLYQELSSAYQHYLRVTNSPFANKPGDECSTGPSPSAPLKSEVFNDEEPGVIPLSENPRDELLDSWRTAIQAARPVIKGHRELTDTLPSLIDRCALAFFGVYRLWQGRGVAELLSVVPSLSEEEIVEALKDTSVDGCNALKYASLYKKDAITPLLDVVSSLSQSNQQAVFSELDWCDLYALLMQAVSSSPKQLIPLLEAVSRLDVAMQQRFFTGRNQDGKNLLMFAAKNNPQAVAPMLGVVAKLGYAEQRLTFGGLTPTQYAAKHFNQASLNNALRPIMAHLEIVYYLGRLQDKVNEFNEKLGFSSSSPYLPAYNAANTLHQELSSAYQDYLRATNSPFANEANGATFTSLNPSAPPLETDTPSEGEPAVIPPSENPRDRLLNSWRSSIQKATPVLENHRGFKDILPKLLRCLVIIPLWIFSQCQGKEFSFFKPVTSTASMTLIGNLSDSLTNLPENNHDAPKA